MATSMMRLFVPAVLLTVVQGCGSHVSTVESPNDKGPDEEEFTAEEALDDETAVEEAVEEAPDGAGPAEDAIPDDDPQGGVGPVEPY